MSLQEVSLLNRLVATTNPASREDSSLELEAIGKLFVFIQSFCRQPIDYRFSSRARAIIRRRIDQRLRNAATDIRIDIRQRHHR